MCDHLSRNDMKRCEHEISSCVYVYFRDQLSVDDVSKERNHSSTCDYISIWTQYDVWN
jgi:hypothetical protein